MVNINNFASLADDLLHDIAQKLEEQDQECEFDIDLNNNILSIIGKVGTYVINTQSVVQEIWLSSPISGPYHFKYLNKKWVSKNGHDLANILKQELNITL